MASLLTAMTIAEQSKSYRDIIDFKITAKRYMLGQLISFETYNILIKYADKMLDEKNK